MQAQTQWAHQQYQQQQQLQSTAPSLHPAQMQAHVTAKINQVILYAQHCLTQYAKLRIVK
jgi:multidrug efflux pump subunit AcrA (membrane-fusion protein)